MEYFCSCYEITVQTDIMKMVYSWIYSNIRIQSSLLVSLQRNMY